MSLGYAVLILVLYTLAVARVTRLVNADTILDPFRIWLAGRVRANKTAAIMTRERALPGAEQYDAAAARWTVALEFTQCPWCVGMWAALAVAYLPVWLIGWPWWALLPVGLAASHLVGVSARFADTEDISIEDDTPTG